jgi:hypothetical protein
VAGREATVSFTYDNRRRLTGETRVEYNFGQETTYDLSYTYDQLGNRQTRHDSVSDLYVEYLYDTDYEDPEELDWPTRNNRLLRYEVRGGGPQGTLLRTVWYTYYKTGDVSNITLKDEYVEGRTPGERTDYTWYHDLALYGTTHGNIAMAVKSRWQLDGEGKPTNYTREWARQFAYDDPRARFMDRDVDPGTYEPNFADPAANRWTGYAGVIPWGDFALSFSGGKPVTSEKVRYLGTAAHQKVSDGSQQYYHGDLIDSVWLTTAGDATPAGFASYTAFGELLDSNGSPAGKRIL